MSVLKSTVKALLPEKVLMHLQAVDHWVEGEPEVRLLPQLCHRDKLAIDVGANIGTYAYHSRRHASRVVAYEPNPGLAQRLQRLLPEVDVRNLAVSDQAGEVVLQVPVSHDGVQQHELASIAQHFDGPVVEHRVRSVTLDSEQHAEVGFIKIDVEQHELAVLRGTMQTITRWRPNIMTEAAPLKYEAGLVQTYAFLLQLGYKGWFSFAGQWLPLDALNASVHLDPANFGRADAFIGNNLLFFPEESDLAKRGPQKK